MSTSLDERVTVRQRHTFCGRQKAQAPGPGSVFILSLVTMLVRSVFIRFDQRESVSCLPVRREELLLELAVRVALARLSDGVSSDDSSVQLYALIDSVVCIDLDVTVLSRVRSTTGS